jgi:hypothetical protein
MRATFVIGGLGLLPLLLPMLYLRLRRPQGRARAVPFLVTAVLGAIVAVLGWAGSRAAGDMRGLALIIVVMIGLVTLVASLVAAAVLSRDDATVG